MTLKEQKKYLPLLNVLKKLNGKDLSEVVDFLNDDAVDNLCECIYNLIHTDMRLSNKKKTSLKGFIKTNCSIHNLKKISSKKVPISKRRKYLKMEGKGLPMLLATIVPFLADLIFGHK